MELLSLFGTDGAAGALARAAARGRDPLGVLDDRARGRVLGRDQHRDAHRARRRRVRHQRPQVVDVRRDVAALRAADRHGRHRPRRRPPPPPEHDPGARRTPRASRSSARRACSATTTARTAGTRRSSTTTSACPAANLLGEEGDGFRIAQERLGPGRIHHAMRAIGMAERALELMCERTAGRSTFGRPIIEHGVVQRWIAEARVKIEQVPPARAQDGVADGHGRQPRRPHRGVGDQGRRPRGRDLGHRPRDPGPRRHGRRQDTLLPELYAVARILQIADGPDEVHHMAIARRETRRYRAGAGHRPEAAAGPPAEPARSLRGGVGSDAHERLADRVAGEHPHERLRRVLEAVDDRLRGSAGARRRATRRARARPRPCGAGGCCRGSPRSVRSLAVAWNRLPGPRGGSVALVLRERPAQRDPAPPAQRSRAPLRGGRRRRCRSRRRSRRAPPRAAARSRARGGS